MTGYTALHVPCSLATSSRMAGGGLYAVFCNSVACCRSVCRRSNFSFRESIRRAIRHLYDRCEYQRWPFRNPCCVLLAIALNVLTTSLSAAMTTMNSRLYSNRSYSNRSSWHDAFNRRHEKTVFSTTLKSCSVAFSQQVNNGVGKPGTCRVTRHFSDPKTRVVKDWKIREAEGRTVTQVSHRNNSETALAGQNVPMEDQ